MTDLDRNPLYRTSASQLAADWRRSFVTDATVKVLSILRKTSAAEIRRDMLVRSPVVPLKASDFPDDSVTRFITLAPSSTIAQLAPLATRIDLSGITVTVPLPDNWAAAAFIAEGAAIPVRQGTFSGMSVGQIKKLALLTAMSGELETASGGAATTIMSGLLENAIRRGADGILLSNSAATDDAPGGLLVGAAAVTGSASMSKDLGALVAEISEAGIDTNSIAFVCAPPQAMSLSLSQGREPRDAGAYRRCPGRVSRSRRRWDADSVVARHAEKAGAADDGRGRGEDRRREGRAFQNDR